MYVYVYIRDDDAICPIWVASDSSKKFNLCDLMMMTNSDTTHTHTHEREWEREHPIRVRHFSLQARLVIFGHPIRYDRIELIHEEEKGKIQLSLASVIYWQNAKQWMRTVSQIKCILVWLCVCVCVCVHMFIAYYDHEDDQWFNDHDRPKDRIKLQYMSMRVFQLVSLQTKCFLLSSCVIDRSNQLYVLWWSTQSRSYIDRVCVTNAMIDDEPIFYFFIIWYQLLFVSHPSLLNIVCFRFISTNYQFLGDGPFPISVRNDWILIIWAICRWNRYIVCQFTILLTIMKHRTPFSIYVSPGVNKTN